MLGQDPDVEALLAGAPDLAPTEREKLRRIAAAFGTHGASAATDTTRAAGLPFAELGPYKLLSRMGEGGMGVVYLAEHRFLRRRVALKVIRPELALSHSTRQRFQHEAMRIARLRHENIVRVFDAGEHEGVAFLAMEAVEGPGLDELLQAASRAGERLDVVSAARYARDIALALQCAHSAGIIHRDVKPSNVRITADGRALLLDFGLSLADEISALSSPGQFRGTPQYASPEQIEPGAAEIDARTDVYSLGVTLYECVSGQVPFAGASMIQLFHEILARDPPAPRRLNERVDEVLNGIVLRAMQKRRELRFADAGEMAHALDDWIQSAGRAAPAAPRAQPSRKLRLAGVAVIVLCAAVWFTLRERGGARAALPHATPRSTTVLLGDASRAFDQRLSQWAPVLGSGTFGADEDGSGVLGVCLDGISVEPYALPGGNGSVRGRMQPIAPSPGVTTRAAGFGIEFSNGRSVALLFVAASDGYDLTLCELLRAGESQLVRGPEIESRRIISRAGQRLDFRLTWNDTHTQFEWGASGASAESEWLQIPDSLRGSARAARFLLVVDRGGARFEDLALEES